MGRILTYDRAVIPAVVLAAGASSRMGRVKALLPFDSRDTFLTHILRTLGDAAVDDVVVVLGHEAERVRDSIADSGLRARIVVNDRFETGQLSSVLAGLAAIDRPGVSAMMMTLVDVPLVSSQTVRAVTERYRSARPPVVRPVNGSRHGHPVIIDRALFDALRAADAASGMKPIVRAHVSAAGDVPVDDEGAFVDVDTAEDYSRFLNRSDARRL